MKRRFAICWARAFMPSLSRRSRVRRKLVAGAWLDDLDAPREDAIMRERLVRKWLATP